jgi:hypothetical protein
VVQVAIVLVVYPVMLAIVEARVAVAVATKRPLADRVPPAKGLQVVLDKIQVQNVAEVAEVPAALDNRVV